MTDTQELLEHLLERHTGPENAITQGKLANRLEMNTSTLRSELRRLREERNIPIANQRNGYYILEDKEELRDYISHINQEIESKRKTIEHTLEAFEDFDGEIPSGNEEPDPEPQEPGYQCQFEDCGKTVPKSEVKYARSGEYEDQPLCKRHFGSLVIEGNA